MQSMLDFALYICNYLCALGMTGQTIEKSSCRWEEANKQLRRDGLLTSGVAMVHRGSGLLAVSQRRMCIAGLFLGNRTPTPLVPPLPVGFFFE
jgi:hypothetical protein